MYFLPVFLAFVCIFWQKFLTPALLVMALIAGLRKGVLGYDYLQYNSYYQEFVSRGNYLSYEPGFSALVDFFTSYGISFEVFIFFVSLFFHFSLYRLLVDLRRILGINTGLLLVLFISSGAYYWLAYVITRQSIAVGILYIGLSGIYLSSNRKSSLLLTSIGGSLFHFSNFFGFVVAFIRVKFVFFAILLMPFVSVLIIKFFSEKYMAYVVGGGSGIGYLIESACILVLSFLFKNDSDNGSIFSYKLSWIFFVFFAATYFFGINLARFLVGFYILYYIPVLILFRRLNKKTRILFLFLVFIFSLLRVHFYILGFGKLGYPYASIFG